MKKPILSVIITCYNLGAYLEEAVSSILNYPIKNDLEIIIINDGSTEASTIEVINNIKRSYPELNIVNQNNQGLAKARNNGIKLAKGDYIIPLDADNKLRLNFIKQAIQILNTNAEISVVHGNAQNFGNKTNLLFSKPFNFNDMVLNNYIDACACFRKTAWEKVEGFDEHMPVMGFEDWDLWLRMSIKGMKFRYINEIFFDYRVRENSMLSSAWIKRDQLVNYIFSKNELIPLGLLRQSLIENQKLSQEPAFKTILKILKNKITRKF